MVDIERIALTLESLPTVLSAMLDPVDPSRLSARPDVGEWCPLEVVGHLIACDTDAFENRVRAIVDGDGIIPGFRPWDAINARDFRGANLTDLLGELTESRRQAGEFVRSLDPDSLTATGSLQGDERRFAAGDFVHEWPFHDQEHIKQIADCLQLGYLPHMSHEMRRALDR